MFINNSVTFDKLGSMNGLAMTLASLTRSAELYCASYMFFFQLVIVGGSGSGA